VKKPLCIDLFCGLGGWADGFLAEGYDVIGFDIERHDYGTGGYPGQLVLQDVLTLDGRQFRNAAVIVASPPCQAYSYRGMPWGALWREHSAMDDDGAPAGNYQGKDPIFNDLFHACFRIAREAGVPIIVENVKGAQDFVGAARWHYGNFYLWGDIPALMPITRRMFEGAWNNEVRGKMRRLDIRDGAGHTRHLTNLAEHGDGIKVSGVNLKEVGFNVAAAQRLRETEGVKQRGSGAEWFDKALDERRKEATAIKNRKDRPDYPYSLGDSRKAASAQIAKIPFPLAQHIARVFKPHHVEPTAPELQRAGG
jgi:C-5 cytosine-specific DNA methylase